MNLAPLRTVERLLLPNACVACERPVGRARPDTLFCRLCRSRLVPILGGCDRCAQPLPPIGPCRFCSDWPEGLTRVASAVWLSHEASELIHHFKYGGYWSLATEMADIMRRHLRHPGNGVVVPIPLARKRLRTRGYNQAALLARALAAEWHLPMGESRLRRVKETRSQTALSPTAREENVTRAFRASPPSARVNDRLVRRGRYAHRIILVDDILTTGATIAAAARALEHVGWTAIEVVTFARARPFALRVAG